MFQSAQDPALNPRGKSICLGQIWTQLLISICPYRLSPRSSFSTSMCPGSRSVPGSRSYTNNIIIEQLSHTSITPKSVYIYCVLWLRTLKHGKPPQEQIKFVVFRGSFGSFRYMQFMWLKMHGHNRKPARVIV